MKRTSFGRSGKRPGDFKMPKPEDQPAPRRYDLEVELCRAINVKVQVELRFENDALWRLFEPYGVYKSTKHKVLVAGTQIANPNDISDPSGPHNFEVAKIRDLRLTDTKFLADLRFDRTDARYRNGFICVIQIF